MHGRPRGQPFFDDPPARAERLRQHAGPAFFACEPLQYAGTRHRAGAVRVRIAVAEHGFLRHRHVLRQSFSRSVFRQAQHVERVLREFDPEPLVRDAGLQDQVLKALRARIGAFRKSRASICRYRSSFSWCNAMRRLISSSRPAGPSTASARRRTINAAQRRRVFRFGDPAPQLLLAGRQDPVRALAAAPRFGRQRFDPARFLETPQLAIDLLVRRLPEITDRAIETVGEFGAGTRAFGKRGEECVGQGHVGSEEAAE